MEENKEMPAEEGGLEKEQEPQVYVVKKGVGGWKFSRRDFLAGAAVAAAAATAATLVTTNKVMETAEGNAQVQEDVLSLGLAMPALMIVQPGALFTQVWRFTNHSDTAWCKGVSLHLTGGGHLQSPPPIPIPDIAPKETVEVPVEMTAPEDLTTCEGSWYLEMAGSIAPVASGSFVLQSSCLAESDHPYANYTNQTWVVTNPDTSAQYTRVHFSRLEVETNFDYVIVRDEAWNEIQRITGYYPSGLWSSLVPGRVVWIQLTSDYIVTGWGFCLDQVETVQAHFVYLPLVIKQPTPTPTPTPRPTATPCACHGVCSCHGHCSCNPYCTCDLIHYWYPN